MPKTKRSERRSHGRHPLVTLLVYCAMGLVAVAVTVGLYFHSDVALAPSVLLGLVLFLVLASTEFALGHARGAAGVAERVEHIEAALAQLLRDEGKVDRLAKTGAAAGRQVEDLSVRLGTLERLAEEYADYVEEQSAAEQAFDPLRTAEHSAEINRLRVDLDRLDARVETLRSQLHMESGEWQERVTSELKLLETLVKQMAERMAGEAEANQRHHAVAASIEQAVEAQDAPLPPVATTDQMDVAGEGLIMADGGPPAAPDGGTVGSAMLDAIRMSIESNRIDLYLQPIVTLPERKVRFYEALTRLRDDAGTIIMPNDYLDVAESAGMMPLIDNIMLFRSVQVLRRLGERSSARGVFCNISVHSLVDAEFFPEFISFMDQNRSLADSLTFEFSQAMLQSCGPIEQESLHALASLGFRFSLDHVHDLDVDFRALHEQNFRFVKLDADMFLNRMGEAGARIHPADMRTYLERFGLELIIEKIEDERNLTNVLDHDVKLAQGYLFSEPRPVRPEVYGRDDEAEAA